MEQSEKRTTNETINCLARLHSSFDTYLLSHAVYLKMRSSSRGFYSNKAVNSNKAVKLNETVKWNEVVHSNKAVNRQTDGGRDKQCSGQVDNVN